VAVGLQGEGDAGVAEALVDHLGRDPGLERRGGVAVAHVVQADLGQPGGPGVLLEPVGDVLGVERATVRPGEHVAVVAVASSDGLAVLSLELALGVQRRKRDGVEGEATAAPLGLGRRVMDLVINNHPGNERGDGGVAEVDVDPAQPGELAAAHARGGDQQPQGVQAVTSDVLEEAA
jgi:hypothetical protein